MAVAADQPMQEIALLPPSGVCQGGVSATLLQAKERPPYPPCTPEQRSVVRRSPPPLLPFGPCTTSRGPRYYAVADPLPLSGIGEKISPRGRLKQRVAERRGLRRVPTTTTVAGKGVIGEGGVVRERPTDSERRVGQRDGSGRWMAGEDDEDDEGRAAECCCCCCRNSCGRQKGATRSSAAAAAAVKAPLCTAPVATEEV